MKKESDINTRMSLDKPTTPKILINVGATLDISTARLGVTKHGETTFIGGIGAITAIVGAGNTFKSTILHYMHFSALNKIEATTNSGSMMYDTEVNITRDRLEDLAMDFEYLPEDILFSKNPLMFVTDKDKYFGDEWLKEVKDKLREKAKSNKTKVTWDYIYDKVEEKYVNDHSPNFFILDSFTEFESKATYDMIDKMVKDDSSTNTFALKQGLYKTKVMGEMPTLASNTNNFFLLTAQLGPSGPVMDIYNQPTRRLQHLKSADKVKGVPPKFFFLTSVAYEAQVAVVMKNKTTKRPLYPQNPEDDTETDLNKVTLKILRNKYGVTGGIHEIMVSQNQGVLPSLTEFYYIKTRKFGFNGNDKNYQLTIYPDVNLSNNTLRSKIDFDTKLQRALNITSEVKQIQVEQTRWLRKRKIPMMNMTQIYEGVIKHGFDWDTILQTRGWCTIDNDAKHLPDYLNTLNLMEMALGRFTPRWHKGKK